MAELYRFFNSTEEDRRLYQAEDFADFFSEFLSSGLVHTDGTPFMSVSISGEDRVTATEGSAIIEGHLYRNTSSIDLELKRAEYPKVDRIVLRLDKSIENRYIKLFVKEGQPSVSPRAPELTRSGDVYELSLASIRIPASGTSGELTLIDERYDEELCGIVDSLISIPVEDLHDDFSQFKNQLNNDFYDWFDDAIRQSNVELLEEELKLIRQNQIEILMQNYIDGKSTDMDAGYFFDVLRDWSKLNTSETTAQLSTINMNLRFPEESAEAVAVWKPHNIGFNTSKVKHYHTRPIQTQLTLVDDALAGQDKIKVESSTIKITEVN